MILELKLINFLQGDINCYVYILQEFIFFLPKMFNEVVIIYFNFFKDDFFIRCQREKLIL